MKSDLPNSKQHLPWGDSGFASSQALASGCARGRAHSGPQRFLTMRSALLNLCRLGVRTVAFTVLLFVTGCSTVLDFRGVSLEYYNLSEKPITVVDIGGFPAMQGLHLLQPNPGGVENPAIRVGQSVQGPLVVPDRIKITWLEGGRSSGSGAPHQIEIPRDEFGVPATLSGRALRFTYLGKDQWRLKVTKRDAES